MSRILLTGNGAAAWGARLARADYIPAFPITPQTEIVETLSKWTEDGSMDARLVLLESEHSMITAAGAAAATGVRVFTATSSQGLLYGMEMIYAVSGWRAPFVMVNVSRGIATPITLESDHNDILAARDSGFLQIHCATCQEVLDTVLLAYKIGEDPHVRLPVFVNMDGFYLSFTREPVELVSPEAADAFLGPFDPGHVSFRASRPMSQATAVLGGGPYSYFRYQTHLGALSALQAHDNAADEFARITGRRYRAVEEYRNEDAEFSLVMIGSFATKAMDVIDSLRDSGLRAGLVRPRLLRPFPEEALKRALLGKKACAVLDQNLSTGKGGILHMEICSALYGQKGAPLLTSFIGGLGGRDIAPEEFAEIFAVTKRAYESGQTPGPRLLYTEEELREMRQLQKVAHAERNSS
jgi:pyruvate ferredoxin oxidoreductase alpha subunit